jgi:hypothetical protein
MARIHAKNANFSFDGVSIEDELNSIEMSVDNPLAEVTALADTGAAFVEGGAPNSKFSIGGAADFAASQGDATIFGAIGQGDQAVIFQPTGNSPNTNDPNYTANVLVASYKVSCDVGSGVQYSADLQVNGAVTRDVTA